MRYAAGVRLQCPSCQAHLDAAGRPPGSRARCGCGATLTLPLATAEAGLLSCPRCGGMVHPERPACDYCAAPLLLRACPRCTRRVFHDHRHCPHCGAASAAPTPAPSRERPCPRCEATLVPRLVADLTLDDCAACGGVYLDAAAVERLIADRQQARAEAVLGVYRGSPRVADHTARGDRLYVKCPDCRTTMNRKQFARTAGVVVDVCRGHGTWFDSGELAAVVEFVGSGGLERAAKADLADERERLRRDRAALEAMLRAPMTVGEHHRRGGDGGSALLSMLFDLWR